MIKDENEISRYQLPKPRPKIGQLCPLSLVGPWDKTSQALIMIPSFVMLYEALQSLCYCY